MIEPETWVQAVLDHRHAMQPIETNVTAQLQSLDSVRAVVFDVYGTLVISGSGDVGSADATDQGSHIPEALAATGLDSTVTSVPSIEVLHEEIRAFQDRLRSESCPKPEVDIAEVWGRVLDRCGWEPGESRSKGRVQMAAQYEARANPTWPMPGATELVRRLHQARIPLGIVSNAQVFTPGLVEDLVAGESLASGGFDLDLCIFSNRFRQAKPGPRLFDVLREGLTRRGILPHEAVYVGNDMLNDIWAASQAGLRTAWFAGDARSCRPRTDDPRCRSLRPDVVLTNLVQLLDCLQIP